MTQQEAMLIVKYMEDKCSREDLDGIIRIIFSGENDVELQPLLYQYWNTNPSFQHRIAEDELNQMLNSVHHRINLQKRNNKRIFHYVSHIAATLFIPLLIVSIWLATRNNINQKDSWITLETPAGSTIKTSLPDGTLVWQNSGTTLQYPAKFSGRKREVMLSGEAYFQVTADRKHPFLVKTAHGIVEATGTKFNVSDFPDDPYCVVLLEEGEVTYISEKQEKVYLLPEEQIIFSKADRRLVKRKADVEKYISWTNGKLIFRDDPLVEIVSRLQRWYNAEIVISDPHHLLDKLTFTMTVQHETLSQVLEYISKASAMTVVEQHRTDQNNNLDKKRYIIKQ